MGTSDGGPQYSALNSQIGEWAKRLGITHIISSAQSPQSNGESEACVKRIKSVISHALLEKRDVKAAIANSNNLQRANGQGSPAELFFNRATRLPGGLATLPNHKSDFSKEIAIRNKARENQLTSTANLREPTKFAVNEEVVIRDCSTGLWSMKGRIISCRDHGGLGVRSYTILHTSTGKEISRNERHIRKIFEKKEEVATPRRGNSKFSTDTDSDTTSDTSSDEDPVYSVRHSVSKFQYSVSHSVSSTARPKSRPT